MKKNSKWFKNEPVCMCKKCWFVGLGQEGGCCWEGERRGQETKLLKSVGQAGSGGGCLKKGVESSIQTMPKNEDMM